MSGAPDDRGAGWERLSALLDEALDLARPQERADWFADLAGREPETAREIAALLAAAASDDAAIDDPSGGGRYVGLVEPGAEESPTRVGEEIGGWKLLRWIGRGGMGEVYLAERSGADFRQRAAVKLLAPGALHPELRSRFARERRILAALAHDGIARFLDGGVAADGTPYLALEFVEGEPLLAWCRNRRASVAARLRIFVDVCAAVEHAHFNLVVHRDLKPSNVLVDGEGRVKLLDFGIAKIVEPGGDGTDGGAAPAERTQLRVMTPRYAAPEQLAGDLVTPATDVYALGLLLFELLAGRPPVEASGADPFAVARALAERGAPRLASVAEVDASRPEGRRLRRALSTDLDRIVARATASEPAARYRSAGALGEDLERFLAGRPVAARGDDRFDRARKFLRRHRVGAAATAAVLVAAALGVASTVHQARLARRSAATAAAEAASSAAALDFLLKLFARSDPAESKGRVYTDDELLDLAAVELERTLAGRVELQLPIYEHLAAIRLQRSQYTQGLELARRALELRRRHDGPAAAATARTRKLVGSLLALLDRPREARAYDRAAIAALAAAGETSSTDYVEAVTGLAGVESELGDFAAAERTARAALALAESTSGPESAPSFAAVRTLAKILSRGGRSAEALRYSERAAGLGRRLFGIEAPDTLVAYGNLAILASNEGENRRLREILDEIEPIERRVFGPRRTDTLALARLRANLEEREGHFAAANAAIEGVIAILRAAGADAGTALGWTLHHAATLRLAAGDLPGAEVREREAVAFQRRTTGADEPAMLTGLACVLLERGQLAEARSTLARADRIEVERGELDGAWRAETLLQLGRSAARAGARAEAREHLTSAIELSSRAVSGGSRSTARALVELVQVLDEPERQQRCPELLDRAVAIGARFLAPDHPERRRWEVARAACPAPPARFGA
ncbi:MAG: serine/threonine-protein kinase [Thermoanaerobaculia bacterium]